ncbi:hypothetical protein [Stenotrophomonas sp.]|uniref:hypothetical protein n=1 Tax=Stenotrophomonas sp. TaxID=69392 RepID=UPI0028AACA62|nr:hypothetical protein [Stenotrophomonas sp.]
MSYDLMVFDPAVAPRDAAAFLEWYDAQTEWNETHEYDDPAVSGPALQAWFSAIIEHFPPLSGPLADDEDDRPQVTDYSVGNHVIYASFADDVAEEAHGLVQVLANTHQLGFFDVSGDGAIVFPDGTVLIPE